MCIRDSINAEYGGLWADWPCPASSSVGAALTESKFTTGRLGCPPSGDGRDSFMFLTPDLTKGAALQSCPRPPRSPGQLRPSQAPARVHSELQAPTKASAGPSLLGTLPQRVAW
eukprot:TRINITY_DN2106_c0_g1_i2.p2 TRINITY_DN2106_c0_g1~~TRINITY_DN2106_c0_g1_i2.p2  ORF type:complete len:114 (+),score=7.08 TRINITY_DN2106_c0_g1_i2:144-485(+)